MEDKIPLNGVREYCEEYSVSLTREEYTQGRWCIHATNEGGNNLTLVDLFDILEWCQLGTVENRTENGFFVNLADDYSDNK